MVLIDNFNRPLLNLRISITSRCNLSCDYCHKEGEEIGSCSRGKANEMKSDEIIRIAKIAVKLGISRIKVTGGEPLIRNDICKIIHGIAVIPGIKDLSMATNGILLELKAKLLKDRGLRRVNISLPTLDPKIYNKLTNGKIENALNGVKSAIAAGLNPVKINMVVLKNTNVKDIPSMIAFAKKTGSILQLIELDPINVNKQYYSTFHEYLDDQEEYLKKEAIKIEKRPYMHNRRIYHLQNVTVEVVHPIENREFCLHCTRLRVTSSGKLKPCLMKNNNTINIIDPLRNGASDKELESLFLSANENRVPFNKKI
ncbi:GTP 3',8-cyclase MoaA [Candidatus Bathyarchaeota archaeon]|nr:GTP 3',8-cyclase MoaA [Asgard group archaeon]TRO49509.1 GTP 3',8-cyclase MoaA [Candidatus Bathyarchaeota archaeon]